MPERAWIRRGRTSVSHRVGVILVVEDDADVRELATRRSWLPVDHRGSAPEALAILATPDPPSIDLMLTDVVMPGGIMELN